MPTFVRPTLPAALTRPRPGAAKRAVDLVSSAALLALGAVPLLVLAAAVAVAERAAPLVREEAAGLGGRPYGRWLFRCGRATWLRRAGLEALPQLWNVLRGEMSLVGPRPLPPGADAPRERAGVRPGMTGLWQVGARSDLPWEEMALLDLHYVEHHWLGMDLAVLARTPRAVLRVRRPAPAGAPAAVPATEPVSVPGGSVPKDPGPGSMAPAPTAGASAEAPPPQGCAERRARPA
ncbi:sugar transferase [Streptomyces sp. NRRL S-87]|uniref:sugar transferase n=1 Tax=Streptomyces sp. NRRL S-87 TaxID=1463920 RepID=UPI0007C57300|nr:sugar transferase [Streptomyces sp. NRRL S-87]